MEIGIGNRIAQLRKARGLTVNRLANKAGISQSYLREIELGHYDNPSIDVLDAICGALDISLQDFFCENKTSTLEDSLLKELEALTPNQRDQLRLFLKAMKS